MQRSTEALVADRDVVLEICSGLDGETWGAPSGCAGWSVKDVISHMGGLFWAAVDPSVLPDVSGMGTEEAQEHIVGSRRGLSASEVLADYAAVSEKALLALEAFAGIDDEIALGDLGTYPARVLPTAFCFDHYTHIRADLFAPRGPLPGPTPPSDELRLAPTLEWIEAAAPQQNRSLLTSSGFTAADVVVSGVAARTIRIGDQTGTAAATATSDAETLVRWITQRGDWQSLGVQAAGDPATLATLQRLKVF